MEWFNVNFILTLKYNEDGSLLNSRLLEINRKIYKYKELLLYNNKPGSIKRKKITTGKSVYSGFARKITLNNKICKEYNKICHDYYDIVQIKNHKIDSLELEIKQLKQK